MRLKRVCKQEVRDLANSSVRHIDKRAFLDALEPLFENSFLEENMKSSFRATGLVPLDPVVVGLRLEVNTRTSV